MDGLLKTVVFLRTPHPKTLPTTETPPPSSEQHMSANKHQPPAMVYQLNVSLRDISPLDLTTTPGH